MRTHVRVTLAVLLSVVACSNGGQEEPATRGTDPSVAATAAVPPRPPQSAFDLRRDLHDALSFAPFDTRFIGYTHWARIAEYEGIDPGGAEAQRELSTAVLIRNAAPTNLLQPFIADVSDAYGFDQTDLVWEAQFGSADGGPWTALKFRDAVDVAALVCAFKRNGFQIGGSGNIVELTHEYDLRLPAAAEGMHELVILRDERVIVFGPSRDAAVRAHTKNQSLADVPALAGMVDAAEAVAAAQVYPTGCTATGPADTSFYPGYPEHRRLAQRQLRQVGGVRPFLAAMFAADRELGDARLQAVLVYAGRAAARSDVDARAQLAGDGEMRQGPYAEEWFTLSDARASRRYVTLTLDPVDDRPDRFLNAAIAGEPLAFAAC